MASCSIKQMKADDENNMMMMMDDANNDVLCPKRFTSLYLFIYSDFNLMIL